MPDTVSPLAAPSLPSAGDGFAKAAADYQSFLKLLTSQLANQDPLAPMDATQFVTQLAQFSQVEQAVQANARMAEVLKQLQASATRLDIGFLGRTVEVMADSFPLSSGQAKFAYAVDAEAATVTLNIRDADGNLVRSVAGATEAGRHEFLWDGRSDEGVLLPDGSYQVEALAKNESGDKLEVVTAVTDMVKELRQSDGVTYLTLNSGAQVPSNDVIAVF